jgi:SAM-dependent methyltransferase
MAMLLKRAVRSLHKKGIVWSVDRALSAIQERLFDLRYGTDTVAFAELGSFTINSRHQNEGYGYQPSRARPFRRLMSALNPPPNSAFVDFGCGKGRLLLLATEYKFRRITGVEFVEELCEIARDNLARYRRKRDIQAEIRIIHQDAAEYAIQDDDNFFFMFNPFAAPLVEAVVRNIAQSTAKRERQVFLIYSNPLWCQAIERQGFSLFRRFDIGEILVYTNPRSSNTHQLG